MRWRSPRAGFRMGVGPFSVYVPLNLWTVVIGAALFFGVARCAHAGAAPLGAPVFLGCLNFNGASCLDGGAGTYLNLQHVVSANAWVYSCATLNATGMCAANTLNRYSTLSPSMWVARDRTYIAGRADGVTFASLPTGFSYDSVAYAAGGQWVVDVDALELDVQFAIGVLLVIVFAITMAARRG